MDRARDIDPGYRCNVFRSLRALFMFWRIFLSYGVMWLLDKVLSDERAESRWRRVHAINARRLTDGFMRLRGVFIKLGQVLSVLGGFLPSAYGRELEKLQDQVPPHPFDEIRRRLEDAFGDQPLQAFESFDETPIAAASLAQVHRARMRDGRAVAVKLLYPNVKELIRIDLGVLRTIEPMMRRAFGLIHTGKVLSQLSDMLAHETDYTNEAENIRRMQSLFEGRTDITVPELVDELCGEGVLTMSFEEGVKITDLDELAGRDIDPEAVAKILVDAFFTMLFQDRIFHADPHPGNFLVREGPTLVILDYGAVEPVTDDLAEGMKQVVLGAMMNDDDALLAGVERMGFVAEGGDRDMLSKVARDYLAVLKKVRIDDFSSMDQETVRKLSGYDQTRGKIRELMRNVHYPDGFFYVERTLMLLFGLVGKLAPKLGLPGLVAPLAAQAMASGFGGFGVSPDTDSA
jgi:predicted unusual protein kinase regulating ubiquinone biosynthesis (AarF/ABC1/UbiB family)